jgi:hypothetical protein
MQRNRFQKIRVGRDLTWLRSCRRLDIKIKIVRSEGWGEYYGRRTLYGQIPRHFIRFLQKNDTVAQYSTPDEPQQNGVTERRNRILMDMIRSMLSYSNLPIGL